MKSNRELRQAVMTAIRGKWRWRILLVLFILQAIAQMVAQSLAQFNRQREIVPLVEFLEKKLDALQQGLDYALPTHEAYRQMWVAAGFEYFVSLVFGSIVLFGLAAVALRAVRNEEDGWLATGFSGFRRPLEIAWLLLLQNLIIGFWTLFLIVPGIVAIYRYRQALYLKCENPDWGALRCLGESARMMKGYKGQSFLLDLYYIGWLFAIAMLSSVGVVIISNGNGVLALLGCLALACCLVAVFYVLVSCIAARAAFYHELKSVLKTETQDDLPRND